MNADTRTAVERYAEEGYVIFRQVLDPQTVSTIDGHVDWLLERHPDRRPEDLTHDLARRDRFWIDLVGDPRLLDIAEMFIGPDIAMYATHYICKPPRTGKPVHWHQDGAFWPLDPMTVVSLWLAVTDSTTDNGCLRVIPGSHRTGIADMRVNDSVDAVFDREMTVEADEERAVDLELAAGDVSVHHPNIHHSSHANHSDRWRRGLTIRYIPTTTRITDSDRPFPFLVRGESVPGINHYVDNPDFDQPAYRPHR